MNAILHTLLSRSLLLLLLTAASLTLFPACGHTLFPDAAASDSSRRSTIDKYYDGDSAIDAANNRRRAGEMGFGYPTGGPNQ